MTCGKAVIFDCETTGVDDPIEVIELSVLEVEFADTKISSNPMIKNAKFKPSGRISLGALATHGIRIEDLKDKPPSSECIQRFPPAEYVIGHNVDYDWRAIGSPDVKRICTLAMARKSWPTLDCHTLVAMMYHTNYDAAPDLVKEAHSSFNDCFLTLLLLRTICAMQGLSNWETVYQFSEQARVPEVMPFGKHKGIPVSEVPADYKRWLLAQPDIDPYLAKALKA